MILNISMVVCCTKSGSVVMAQGGSVIVARLQNTGSVIVAHNTARLAQIKKNYKIQLNGEKNQ